MMDLRFAAGLAAAFTLSGAVIACESVPDLSFPADGALDATAGDATAGDGYVAPADDGASPGSDAGLDGSSLVDAADGALACNPPPGVDASCCPQYGGFCIGLACPYCNECLNKGCKTTDYCCASVNAANQVKGVTCQTDPRAMCP